MSAIGISAGYSPASGVSFPKFGAPNIGEAYREARQLARQFDSLYGNDLRAGLYRGTRIGARFLPLLIAVEAGWWLADPKVKAWGKRALDIRGSWTLVENCGRPSDYGTPGATYSSCGQGASVAGPEDPLPDGSQAFVKGFTLWQFLGIYINGVSWVGNPSAYYEQVGGPPISMSNNIAVAFPMAVTDWTPAVLALQPYSAPILRPRQNEQPIPFPVLPHLRPNIGMPSLEQYLQSYTPQLVETFPAEPISPPQREIFPVVAGLLNPTGAEVARPGIAIEVPSIPHALPRSIASTHFNRPPQKGEKERKFILKPTARNIVLQVFNTASETKDFIDAMYKSIPRRYTGNIVHGRKQYDRELLKGRKVWFKGPDGRWKSRWINDHTLQEKADYIYRNLDGIDIGLAVENYVRNEIEDRVYGAVGKLHAKAARAQHAAGGPGSRSATLSRSSGIDTGSGRLPVDDVIDYVKQAFE